MQRSMLAAMCKMRRARLPRTITITSSRSNKTQNMCSGMTNLGRVGKHHSKNCHSRLPGIHEQQSTTSQHAAVCVCWKQQQQKQGVKKNMI
jgi:hypothetical protein